MRLVILGSGTCVPSGTRSSAGYWVEAGRVRLRLDCGAGTLHAMGRHALPWQRLTHQFVSHFHLDHVGELPALLFALKYGRSCPRSEPLELLGPAGLGRLLEGWGELYGRKLLEHEFPLLLRELEPGQSHELDAGVRLRVAKTLHTNESLAVRIDAGGRSIGYTGDTAPSPLLAELFAGVDLLVGECSFLEPGHGTAHLTADELAALAAEAEAGHLVATHFYFDPQAAALGERLSARYAGRVTLAADGMAIDLGGRDPAVSGVRS
jgi:ribonuclease BN (tRNA processing enzyme)